MARIAVIIADFFEDSEYSEPSSAFQEKGHQIIHVGLEQNKKISGKRNKITIHLDEEVSNVKVNDFDALLIPGGFSPDKLRAFEEPVDFVRDFVNSGKPVFMICHGPQLLISAQVLEGRIITGWKSIKQDIINAGAEYKDQEVVVDGNLVSSRSPADLPAFIKESLDKLKKQGGKNDK
jgi:protease I